MSSLPTEARRVLDYWLGDAIHLGWPSQDRYALWFGGDSSVDLEIQSQFGDLVNQAVDGGMMHWKRTALGRLALVILLDQFTRNIHRRRAAAFAGDERAQSLVREALSMHEDEELPLAGRIFLFMPLEHAEDIELQAESVHRFSTLAARAPNALAAMFSTFVDYALLHRDIVALFGRFPHRNAALMRASTPRELEFLKDGPRFGQ